MSNYPDLNSCLLSFAYRAVFSKVSNFTILEACLLIVTPLALFFRETIVSLPLGISVLSLLLYLASYNSIFILVVSTPLPFYVSYIRLEVFLLVVPFLKLIINARR